MKWLTVLLLLQFIIDVSPWGNFCSVICGTSCNGNLNTNCSNSCQTDGAWLVSGNTCGIKTSANWVLFDSTPDYNSGTLSVTGASLTGACNNMNYYGFVNPSATITVSTPGINYAYYQMKVYASIIAIDINCGGGGGGSGCGGSPPTMQSSTYFTMYFNDPQIVLTTNPIVTSTISKASTRSDLCGTYNKYREYYWRIGQTYNYNTTGTSFNWDFACTQTTNMSSLWGIREFVILTKSCNYACASCYGTLSTQCYTCISNATHVYWQSNNTCNETCLNHFGYSAPNICVYCDLRCTECYMILDNCTACTTSGTWAAYLDSTLTNLSYPTCANPCPTGYFGNKTVRTCDPCNISCATCINSPNYCTSCIVNTTFWTGWFCYNPCPTQYFLDPNGTNCTKCSPFCNVCEGVYNVCTVCTLSGQFQAYLYNTTNLTGSCERICPATYYGETYSGLGPNLCLACNPNCTLCTGYPSPCSQCIPGFYLISSTCTDTCPNGTIASNSTGVGLCLDCDKVCVGLTISMYFPSVVNDQVYIDMIFSQSLNYSTFNQDSFQSITITSENIQYTLDMFTQTIVNLTSSSYRIILQPKTYIFLYNATFTLTTTSQPTPIDTSLSYMPFKTTNYLKTSAITWFLIKGPPFTQLQIGVMNSLSILSTKTNSLLALPYLQEIKKSGVFNLIFSGAQITSCSMLSNQIQSQNLYEGVRIWAVFVFFDAPPYEKISDKTKRFVDPTVQDKIRNAQEVRQGQDNGIIGRGLFSTNTMYWRFQRTGQTSFFIYDVYVPMFLLALCWIGLLIAHCNQKKRWFSSYAGNLYSSIHKIHQMTMMYITMAAIVQFIYFQPTSSERVLSAILCIAFNIYFAIYELYIYKDMIRYPLAEIGNPLFDYYAIRYGYFLKNIRFEEYDIQEEWTPKHWLRPYNYHLLSYYKKFIMIITLPIFYSIIYAQMGILTTIQLLQTVRFFATWPFRTNTRNYFRLSLEISLFLFFIINLIQISLLQTIMTSDASGLEIVTKYFYGLGWAGFAFCTYFNLGHVCSGIYDLCVGLKRTSRSKMQAARKEFYCVKIRQYQKDNESSSKALVNKWVQLGNLNDKNHGQLPQINIRIQLYQLKKINNKLHIKIKKLRYLKMKSIAKLRRANNTTSGDKLQKEIIMCNGDTSRLYSIMNDVYRLYQGPHVQTIRIKTFLNVWQKDYKEGQEILFDRNMMFQRVELISYDNEKEEIQLEAMLNDFPIDDAAVINA